MDNKTLFLIHQHVDAKVFKTFVEPSNSKNVWDILVKIYGGGAKFNK